MQVTSSEDHEKDISQKIRSPKSKSKKDLALVFTVRRPKIHSISLNKSCSSNILIEDNYEQSYLSSADHQATYPQLDSERQSKYSTSTFHSSNKSTDFYKSTIKIEDVLKELINMNEELSKLDKQVSCLEKKRAKV